MNGIKNKIITISGEPVSGKSTVVKMIKSKYEEMGYKVHVVSTGQLFREIITKEYLKMYPDRTNVNLADIQTDESFAKKRGEIDGLVDEQMARKGQEINSKERPNDVYIIDSRLAWHNIPESFAVRLTVDEKIAGSRVFADKSRGSEDAYKTLEDAVQKTRQRKLGEIERYKERYGIDLSNPENYDLIVDTSFSNTEELAGIIIEGEKSYREGVRYPKFWASPACFIGTQTDRETWSAYGTFGCTPEDLAEKMKKEGIDFNRIEITILENCGQKFVQDGHHRCMAILAMGRTLIPYYINKNLQANKRMEVEQNNVHFAYDWSDCIRSYGGYFGKQKQFENFRIEDLTAYENRLKGMLEELSKKRKEGR